MNKGIVAISVALYLVASAFAEEPATVSTVYELEALFVEQQYDILPMSPPSQDVYIHSLKSVVPVEWKKFPNAFKKLMYAQMDENGYPIYGVMIYEDPATRETVFLNSYGQEVYRIEAEKDYDPYLWLKDKYQIADAGELDELHRWIFDPAHVAMEFELLPETFYADYSAEQAEVVAAESMMAMPMMMSLPAVVTNLQVSISTATNGAVEVEVGWPSGFTNDLEIFATDDLVEYIWDVVCTGITTTNTGSYLWADWASTNIAERFYCAGDADIDTDGDSLSDAREILMYGSDPEESDSDLDGLNDDVEVGASLPTDPLNSDRTAPAVSISSPVNNIVVVP